ncbi:twin-arginine translocation signal domain-containing protein [Mailhella massiliensis]|uniref:twin-arginine translocation signal domain-containing protein n=1 Tax=Mailhella massiliensis TaxID=1903261 RepID=UPI0023F3A55B|nr:twin-arginine translocation signal domain-containing protein [Mailhella massiliensis]
MSISRRNFVRGSLLAAGAVAAGLSPLTAGASERAKVYFTKDLSAESLLRLYRMVNQNITGNIAVKLHTGEPDGPNILPREWVKAFLTEVPHTTIVECNVLYASPRQTTEGHRRTLERNGWTEFATVDIMDEDGDTPLPSAAAGGSRKWLWETIC